MPNRLLEDNGYLIFETALRCGKSRKHDVHGVILGTQQNGGSSIAIQVEEVSTESVASNLSNNPAAKSRQVKIH